MYELISNIEGSKWSFLKGYHIFDFQRVALLKKEDYRKYELLDKNGKKMDVDVKEFLVEI